MKFGEKTSLKWRRQIKKVCFYINNFFTNLKNGVARTIQDDSCWKCRWWHFPPFSRANSLNASRIKIEPDSLPPLPIWLLPPPLPIGLFPPPLWRRFLPLSSLHSSIKAIRWLCIWVRTLLGAVGISLPLSEGGPNQAIASQTICAIAFSISKRAGSSSGSTSFLGLLTWLSMPASLSWLSIPD